MITAFIFVAAAGFVMVFTVLSRIAELKQKED
jgi:hypothetical protein